MQVRKRKRIKGNWDVELPVRAWRQKGGNDDGDNDDCDKIEYMILAGRGEGGWWYEFLLPWPEGFPQKNGTQKQTKIGGWCHIDEWWKYYLNFDITDKKVKIKYRYLKVEECGLFVDIEKGDIWMHYNTGFVKMAKFKYIVGIKRWHSNTSQWRSNECQIHSAWEKGFGNMSKVVEMPNNVHYWLILEVWDSFHSVIGNWIKCAFLIRIISISQAVMSKQ